MSTAYQRYCQWFLLALGTPEELSASTDMYMHPCVWVGGGGSPLFSSAIFGKFMIPVPPEIFLNGHWYVSVIYCNSQINEKGKQELFATHQVAFYS